MAVITLLALSPAPEERMAFALQGYKVLRTRFYASQYLPLAALLLADWARGRDLDGVAARAEEIYRRMKREHPFLTGAEDSVFAVLLALSPDTEQAVVDQVEACYDALKHPFGTGQYTQALSHVLALGRGVPRRNVTRSWGCTKVSKQRAGSTAPAMNWGHWGAWRCCPLRWKN